MDRGRSRQVANSALARQASEERSMRIWPPIAAPVPKNAVAYPPPFIVRSASPSPPSSASMSPDYYDSPPSPPRSLEDQVHVAYALDDIHLAKILLLRLKGIEVTSDDDPRIAAVQDEDFDFCFIPNGGLMNEQDEKMIREMQAREVERLEEKRRQERLRHCERKWEEEKKRLREARLAVLRKKEKKNQDEQHIRRRKDDGSRASSKRTPRNVLAINHAPPSPPPRPHSQQQKRQEFFYDFPMSSRTPPLIASSRPPPPPPQQHQQCTDVPFSEVLRSMQGALFPDDAPPRNASPRSRTRSQPKHRKQNRLLDALLVQIEYTDEERRNRKGKQKAQPVPHIDGPCLACEAHTAPCPPPAPMSPASSSSSSSSIHRTSSWLSFRGSSASSSTTDLTTPSSSPIPSSSWFNSRSKAERTITPAPPRHSCHPRSSRLIPVTSPDDLPLPIDVPPPPKPVPISHQGRPRSSSTVRAAKEGAGGIVRRMSKFVELAKGFQNAYVTSALFATGANASNSSLASGDGDAPNANTCYTLNSDGDKDFLDAALGSKGPSRSTTPRPKLRPEGYRVSSIDVAAFLNPDPQHIGPGASGSTNHHNDVASITPTPRYIPLTSSLSDTPRTILPDPLPYKLHFKPVPTPIRSPFRFHALSQELHTIFYSPSYESTHHLPGKKITWRIRSVGNPAHLRLKAVGNILWKRGGRWEGVARDTAMGGARERIVGVAYEGLGRSCLSMTWDSSSMC
ncbi:hypothetical protein D9613_004100 [Agrocybe pediades]|uniref:Uncharacterized protein n=1 Tax=Agrocybe pediades TaxID=84607 RepID=A0A8H4VL71_9AGAR|nr:hypothetical protein D9613_004100 [Agrocybe pediades]